MITNMVSSPPTPTGTSRDAAVAYCSAGAGMLLPLCWCLAAACAPGFAVAAAAPIGAVWGSGGRERARMVDGSRDHWVGPPCCPSRQLLILPIGSTKRLCHIVLRRKLIYLYDYATWPKAYPVTQVTTTTEVIWIMPLANAREFLNSGQNGRFTPRATLVGSTDRDMYSCQGPGRTDGWTSGSVLSARLRNQLFNLCDC